MASGGSYFLENRSEPLVVANHASLNETLQTEHIDVDAGDQSFEAGYTRAIAECVGSIFTPRQVLAVLRILKAITLCFIVLSILADVMYILFVQTLAGKEVRHMAGGTRDILMRLYALVLLTIALAIEVDYTKLVRRYSGLKAFVPRSLLYLFIAVITASVPNVKLAENRDEAYENGDDDAYENEDAADAATAKIPSSAVGFQVVASFVLGCCAIAYLVCGLLCFDRFTARAFLSDKDPRLATAIRPPSKDRSEETPDMENSSTDPNARDSGDSEW